MILMFTRFLTKRLPSRGNQCRGNQCRGNQGSPLPPPFIKVYIFPLTPPLNNSSF